MVGTGVFVSLGFVAESAGSLAWLSVLLAAGLALCNALSSAQLAAAHPVSGGAYEYGSQYVHPALGYSAGWMFLCAKSATAAAACLAMADALMRWVAPGGPVSVTACVLALLTTALAATGLRKSNLANMVLILFVLGALFIGCIAAWQTFTPPDTLPIAATPNARQLLGAAALAFVAFTGYGRIATLGEEIRDPQRSIPRAVLWTVFITAIVYLTVIFTLTGRLTESWDRTGPVLPSILSQAPPWIPALIQAAAVVCLFSVLLNLILGLSRVLLAMARRGHMPSALQVVSEGPGGPVRAVWTSGFAIAGCALLFSLYESWTFSAMTVLLYYAVMNVCALRLTRPDRKYPAWVSGLGLAGCLTLCALVPSGSFPSFLIAVATGFFWFFGMKVLNPERGV